MHTYDHRLIFDFPGGRSLTVRLLHHGDDRDELFKKLEKKLIAARYALDISWNDVALILSEMRMDVYEL